MYGDPKTPQRGSQLAHTWPALDVESRPLGDYSGPESLVSLTRVTISGRVFVDLQWGTGQLLELKDIRAPLVAHLPGKYTITARPIDAGGATAKLQAVPIQSGGATPLIRQLVSTLAPLALHPLAAYFDALVASTLTVAGIAVAAAAGSRYPLLPDSTLNTGSGVLEFHV